MALIVLALASITCDTKTPTGACSDYSCVQDLCCDLQHCGGPPVIGGPCTPGERFCSYTFATPGMSGTFSCVSGKVACTGCCGNTPPENGAACSFDGARCKNAQLTCTCEHGAFACPMIDMSATHEDLAASDASSD